MTRRLAVLGAAALTLGGFAAAPAGALTLPTGRLFTSQDIGLSSARIVCITDGGAYVQGASSYSCTGGAQEASTLTQARAVCVTFLHGTFSTNAGPPKSYGCSY